MTCDQKADRAIISRDSDEVALTRIKFAYLLIKKDQSLVIRASVKKNASRGDEYSR